MITAREKILVEGLSDWVDLGQLHWYLAEENPTASLSDVQNETLQTLRSLVTDGLVEVGDLSGEGGRFVAWDTPLDESIERISDEYITHFDNREWRWIFWLNPTEKGEQVARSLEKKYDDWLRVKRAQR